MNLTEKQVEALRAVANPHGSAERIFWMNARARWQGPRKTLGSLEWRGLVSYTPGEGWAITAAGREALAELEAR